MNRYSKGTRSVDHTIDQVFAAYEVNRETAFVETFFGQENECSFRSLWIFSSRNH